MLTDDQHGVNVDAGLSIVALFKATARSGHDPRFFIGEIDLIFITRAGYGRLWFLASCLLAGFLLFVLARGKFLLVVCLFFGKAFVSSLFDFGFGFGNGGEALFATRQFSRDVQAIRKVSTVGFFSLSQKVFNFSLNSIKSYRDCQIKFELLHRFFQSLPP
jgi:hypothetical protein